MAFALTRGMLLPPFSLPAANRSGEVTLWDYKPRRSLVLLLLPEVRSCRPLLEAVERSYDEYRNLNGEVVVISPEPLERLHAQSLNMPFPVLSDAEAKFYQQRTGEGFESAQATALIADRWGEVHGRVVLEPRNALSDEVELREWLRFVEIQCEECFPPEWPLE